MTAFICLSILSIKFFQNFSGISRIQTNLIASIRARIFEGCLSATLSSRTTHKFSIRLSSGLFPGHSRRVILLALKKFVTIFERWNGAPSCINILQSCTDMCSCSFSFIKFKYFWPFIVVSGFKKKTLAVPLIEMVPHTITLGGCLLFSGYTFHYIGFLEVGGHFSFLQQTVKL